MDPADRDRSEDVATLLRARTEAARATAAAYLLVVIDGPDRGAELRIDGSQSSRVLAGQSPACQLRLTDRTVSRRHAAFDATSHGLRVVDLGSTNGTTANGIAIGDACMRGGEILRLGDTTLRVDLVGAAQPLNLPTAMRFGRMLGQSPSMRRLYPYCERLAASDVPVVIEGETGTGKELLAEAIHEESARADAPFVVFDCTAVAPTLMESALFGHERGAFTGAVSSRRGVFEQAHGGTLLIDEIGDLDIALQAKLLRAIERGKIQRVGGDGFVDVDVRVLAATRRDLDREVAAGRFRDDLFFRLAVARIELPPLRQRRGDVALLGQYFWRQMGGQDRPLPPDLLQRFEDYTWPGNVRELANAVARRLALGSLPDPARGAGGSEPPPDRTHPPLAPPAPPEVTQSVPPAASATDFIDEVLGLGLALPASRQRVVDEFERRYVEGVLARNGGSVVKAAAASGIARRYFQMIRARQGK